MNNNQEIFVAILAGTFLFLLFSVFIIAYIVIYWKKKIKHLQEVEGIKLLFSQELLNSRLEIKEQTLNDVSQEIHDNVGQMLTLAKLQINLMDSEGPPDRSKLTELKETISQALSDLRNIAHNLTVEKILLSSLPQSIKDHIGRISKTGIIDISMEVQGIEQKIDDKKNLILFRMLQESLQNMIKHSKASQATVTFNYGAFQLNISVSDNGVGFDTNIIGRESSGLGLKNIMSRAALIGGKVRIQSALNNGTNLLITMPYA